ncbi:DUF2848 domain-containing protein [Paraburkholderia dipogonis]|uniref:DUF2848 domain-containing protein n=2 Tax=Paraburkholderia dipogonis TaxID=1211383 RepID=A0A4Y8MKH4_9BURK|nr:DUF2848 domain-containing protein [Paraburkholderia dipogonis]
MLQFNTPDGDERGGVECGARDLIIAGWTGRDKVAMEAHIIELEKLGVRRPEKTPIFYRGASTLLTQNKEVEIVGADASGEVEPVIFSTTQGIFLGLGSDHTDRKVETVGIAISKQLCAKPVSHEIWKLDRIADHWDQLVIRSWISRGGERRKYQEGTLAKMRHPADLLRLYGGESYEPPEGTVMFCGTLAVCGEIESADLFEMELEDPVLGRKIQHHYRVIELPVAG